LATAVLLAGCGSTPPPIPGPPAPNTAPAPRTEAAAGPEGLLLARSEQVLLVRPGPGATWANLARHWLNDASRAWEVAALNATDPATPAPAPTAPLPPGREPVLLPLRPVNPTGLQGEQQQTVTILCYHRIGTGLGRMGVPPERFAQQMEWLAGNGYTVLPLAQVSGFLNAARALPPRSVVVTFDDGYESVYRHAFPVLRRLGFPATLFLYTDFVGAGGDALSWAQAREMAATGLIDFQAHSRSHANLTQRHADEAEPAYRQRIDEEVRAPRDAIQRELAGATAGTAAPSRSRTATRSSRTVPGSTQAPAPTPAAPTARMEPAPADPAAATVQHFAYPFGDGNEAAREALRRQRYELGLTVNPGGNPFQAHPLMLRRTMIFGSHDLEAFKARLQAQRPLPPARS
jgi:peptidoglycan/xylan/chitin deacetylase (PgdA/CDA1 family)